MIGTFQVSLIKSINARQRDAYRQCSEVAFNRIYRSKPVLDVELDGYRVMTTLMEQLIDAVVNPDRFYSKQLLMRVSSQYEINAPDVDTRIMAAVDFISGMTDVFALDFYQKINGTSLADSVNFSNTLQCDYCGNKGFGRMRGMTDSFWRLWYLW